MQLEDEITTTQLAVGKAHIAWRRAEFERNNLQEQNVLDDLAAEVKARTDYVTMTKAQLEELKPDLTIAETETDWDLKRALATALTAIGNEQITE